MKNIINKHLTEIFPYENNPRFNDKAVENVANSIKQFGFRIPIIIDNNSVIICGHTRLKAAEELGLKTVPCIMADDLTPEQVKAFRLIDNKTAEQAEWDFERLDEELRAISDVFNMDDFGFSISEDDFSCIEVLLNEDFAGGETTADKTEFNITFGFPIEHEEIIKAFIKDNGKEWVVTTVIEEARQWQE